MGGIVRHSEFMRGIVRHSELKVFSDIRFYEAP